MSLENVKNFTAAARSNPALAAKMESATSGKSPNDAANAFSTLGKSEGYDFSPADALEFRNTYFSQELSEQDLNNVAGGAGDPYVTTATTVVAGQLAGELVPGAGGVIGAGVGAAVGTAVAGGSASESTAAGAMASASALDDFKSVVTSIFSGW